MGTEILSELGTEILIPICAVIGIVFSLLQWFIVSRVKLTPSTHNNNNNINNKNGYGDYLIEEEEAINDHNVVAKCAEIQTAISDGEKNSHAKLLAIEFLSLTALLNSTTAFSLRSSSSFTFTRAETVGVVTTRDLKPSKFLRFTVDDSTGSVPCILWLNQLTSPYFSRRSPLDVSVVADVASQLADLVRIGAVVRVRGKIGVFRGTVQMTVTDLVCERDPNAEILHWLECIRLSRRRSTRTAT